MHNHGEEILAGIALVIVACCVFAQVVSRYVFGTAITWTEELAGFAMVWAVQLGSSYAIRERFHIRITLTAMLLPHALALPLFMLGDVLWMGFNLFMVWQGWEYLLVLWQRTYISPSLGIEQKWPQSIVLIGYVLMSLRVAEIYVQWIKCGYRGLPGLPATES